MKYLNEHTCADCSLKHLAAAGVILQEMLNGYNLDTYAYYLLGNLNEAEEQIISVDPAAANAIRQLRRALFPSGLTAELSAARADYLREIALGIHQKSRLGLYQREICACNSKGTDIVIPLKTGGSPFGDMELKLALRSIEKNLTGYNQIFIAARKLPAWIQHVEFVKTEDLHPRKQMNIHDAIKKALRTPGLSDEIIFWADDNILLTSCHVRDLPLAGRKDDLLCYSNAPDAKVWHQSLKNTGITLQAHHRKTTNFEAHTPVKFSRRKYLELEKIFDFDSGVGLCYISLYCNYFQQEPTVQMQEVKVTYEKPQIDKTALQGKLFAGYNDAGARAGALTLFESLFPQPSRYEQKRETYPL